MKTIGIIAIAMLLVLGGVLAVTATTMGESTADPVFNVEQLSSGCEYFCGWCLPMNGDGICNSRGSCC